MEELTWLPLNADEIPSLEEPCSVPVPWIRQNGVYPREPGSFQRRPPINDLAQTFRVDGPYAR